MSKTILSAAVAVILAAGALTASPSWAGEAKNTASKAANKQLKASSDAMNAKNWNECVAKAKEALAAEGRTAYDAFLSNQLMGFCFVKQGNTAEAAIAYEAQLQSGFLPPDQQTQITKGVMQIAYQQKDYPKAVDLGNRLIKGGGADTDVYTVVGQSLYLQKKYSETAKFMADYVGDQEKRGQQPKEQSLMLLQDSYSKAGNSSGAADALEKMVMYYPKKEYWKTLMYSLRRIQGMNDRQTLQVYRLMVANGTMEEPTDYSEMAELAVAGGNPAEAQKVLEAGIAASVFVEQRDKDRANRMLESVKKSAATDLANLPKLEKEVAGAKTGDVQAALGNAYLSFGRNQEAADALAAALAKGGLKSTADVQLTQGVALVRAGNKGEALKAFKAVKTDDMIYSRIAKLWSLYVQ